MGPGAVSLGRCMLLGDVKEGCGQDSKGGPRTWKGWKSYTVGLNRALQGPGEMAP